MVPSGLPDAEYLDVKVFLYKYTPKFTFIGENSTPASNSHKGAPSQDALAVFRAMVANIPSLQRLIGQVTSGTGVGATITGASTGVPISASQVDAVRLLAVDYEAAAKQGAFIFTTKDVTTPGLTASLQKVMGTSPTNSTSPSTIALAVAKKLSTQGMSAQSVVKNLTVPEYGTTSVTGIQGQQAPGTSGMFNALLAGLSQGSLELPLYQGYKQDVIYSMWRNHAISFGKQLDQLQQYATTLTRAGTTSTQEHVEQQFRVARYAIDLNASRYFSKYNLTPFLKDYSFNQALQGNEYTWSTTFQDVIIPFADLDPNTSVSLVRKPAVFRNPEGGIVGVAEGPPCTEQSSSSSTTFDDLVYLMAQYEAESAWPTSLATEVGYIKQAFLSRGLATTPFATSALADASNQVPTVNALGTPSGQTQANGIRLSDLLQKYNFISVFVYKSSISPTQARKSLFPKGLVPLVNKPSGSGDSVQFDESNEVHLMLAGYKNEFNGFITEKTISRATGQVDRVIANGHGILRLFSDTLSLYDASLLARGVYAAAELSTINPSATLSNVDGSVDQYYTVNQNRFQGKDPIQIVRELLALVYRIAFSAQYTTYPGTSTGLVKELQGFFDIATLVASHDKGAAPIFSPETSGIVGTTQQVGNLFTIAPFLVALVMALRNHNYSLTSQAIQLEKETGTLVDPDTKFQEASTAPLNSAQFHQEFGGPCVQITDVAERFNPYFVMLKNGFGNFISSLKSPTDIMNQVVHTSLLEFYEKPNGRIVLRTPQYNQADGVSTGGVYVFAGNAVTSDDTQVVSAQYAEEGTGLKARKRGSYYADLIGLVGGGLIQPSYTSGKLMMQYGFREGEVEPNPNLRPAALSDMQALGQATILNLIHKYVRFILEVENAALRSGVVTLNGHPNLEVGKLFFDLKNRKVGYIIRVRKSLSVGGTYQATITLRFVRDLGPGDISEGPFRQLPTLEELVTASSQQMQVGLAALPPLQFAPVLDPATVSPLTFNP